ncbi:hypothetical protein BC941DRAFT_427575 [Chlamydoabsidia padenii]|nr:hypothetical protein BC941DRAFT_427575 [Chlamydoabsidia padenii]
MVKGRKTALNKRVFKQGKRPTKQKRRGNRGSSRHYLQGFEDLPTEIYIHPDHDGSRLKVPSLKHLQLDSDDDNDDDNDHDEDLTTQEESFMIQPDDAFYFDAEPSDITFTQKSTTTTTTNNNNKNIPTSSSTIKSNAKSRKAEKIIPGDDIFISSDDETLMAAFNNNNVMTFHDESAIDQDFIENTDPETWQQLQQWATQRSVDEPNNVDSKEEELYMDDKMDRHYVAPTSHNALFDFGLCDSDDDEFIQQRIRQDKQKQLVDIQQMNWTIRNTLSELPPSLHKGMHGYIKLNKRRKLKEPKRIVNEDDPLANELRRVDRRIRLFFEDHSRRHYQLPAMTLFCRNQVRALAEIYKLHVSFEDLGCKKVGPLISKVQEQTAPLRSRSVERHIQRASKEWFLQQQKEQSIREKKDRAIQIKKKRKTNTFRQRPISEEVEYMVPVGSTAAPLASNNLGHKMLAKMGWKEGDSLGANNDGITDPIQAVIRHKRRGLGA